MKGWTWCRSIVGRTGKGPMSRLPLKTRKTLIVNTILLVMSFMKTCKAKCFLRLKVMDREVMEFLKE